MRRGKTSALRLSRAQLKDAGGGAARQGKRSALVGFSSTFDQAGRWGADLGELLQGERYVVDRRGLKGRWRRHPGDHNGGDLSGGRRV